MSTTPTSSHDPQLVSMSSKSDHYIQMDQPDLTRAKSLHEESQNILRKRQFTLEWNNICLEATTTDPKTNVTSNKVILNSVDGFAKPGELLVIMGPSGAGKSSLLDCISGRNPEVRGDILVNGSPWTKQLKGLASYVMQDDLFYATLTVQEHLTFSAELKMGRTHSKAECLQRVNTVMEELGLTKCRNTLIGNERIRGISGGERKRLSFATELLTNPSILFADEPTSGLDSYMAEQVVLQLQQLARFGRTVIATIHQPSSEVFALFDQLYLLSDGSPVYHGKATDAVPYFASMGYQCPPYINPCDYFMRQLVVMDKSTDPAGVERIEKLKESWRVARQSQPNQPSIRRGVSHGLSGLRESLPGIRQIAVLAKRNVVRIVRDRVGFMAQIIMTIFVSLLVGLTYYQNELTQAGIQNFIGVFFFMSVNQVMSSANPQFVNVPMEIPIILREYKSGLYHLASWYVAKNVSELPIQLFIPLVFLTPLYFLVGIGQSIWIFLKILLMLMLVNSSAIGLGYMVSCIVRRVDVAPLVGIVFLLPFLLFGGLFVNSDTIPVYFAWIKYISPIKYCFESLMMIYWTEVSSIGCDVGDAACLTNGTQVLQRYAIDPDARSVLVNAAILFCINLGFRIAGFIFLWLNVRKQK